MPAAIEQRLTTAQAARAIGVSEQTIRYDPVEIGRVIAQRQAMQRERAAGKPRHVPRAAEGRT